MHSSCNTLGSELTNHACALQFIILVSGGASLNFPVGWRISSDLATHRYLSTFLLTTHARR